MNIGTGNHILQRSGKGQEWLPYITIPLFESRADGQKYFCTFKTCYSVTTIHYSFKSSVIEPKWKALDS